jgi:hypothetical protein
VATEKSFREFSSEMFVGALAPFIGRIHYRSRSSSACTEYSIEPGSHFLALFFSNPHLRRCTSLGECLYFQSWFPFYELVIVEMSQPLVLESSIFFI